jgi:hypothetical protein
MPGPNDLPPVPNYQLDPRPLSFRDRRLPPGWEEERLKITYEDLQRSLRKLRLSQWEEDVALWRAMQKIGPARLTGTRLGELSDKINKLYQKGDWNYGLDPKAIGRGLLDLGGIKSWTTELGPPDPPPLSSDLPSK